MILCTLKLPSAFVLDVQSVKHNNLLQTYIDYNEDVTDKIKSFHQNNKAIYDKTEETLEKFCVKLTSFFLTQDSQCESVAHNAGSQVVNQKSIKLNV